MARVRPDHPDRKLYTLEDVASELGVSYTHMIEEIKAGFFPDGYPVGKREKRWAQEDIDYYLYRLRRFGRGKTGDQEAGEEKS